jgi:predicted nucleic acid-binding protein
VLPSVVLDTNVWVSAFLNPHGFPAKLIEAWFDDAFKVAMGHGTLLLSLLS